MSNRTRSSIARDLRTHEVTNQVPELRYDAWLTDLPLREAIEREGGGWAGGEVAELGPLVGGPMMEMARLANENRPKLKTFDRFGHRLDEVEFHPSYHQLMALAIEHELPSFGWRRADRPGAHVARMALGYLYNQADQGTGCPLTMTYACVPTLRHQPELAASWLPKVLSTDYDPRSVPLAEKRGVTIGMGMTEKQGGSDVRSNTTRAHPSDDEPGSTYALVGHKWFFSAPMCDAWLVLAQAEGGLSCFLMPRLLPDGSTNAIHIQRLKDKLGDWSNASSEVELRGALAWLVGEEGRGIPTILEMVALTRQDCMIGSAAIMRQALVQALHHARHRKAFGRRLVDHPLMRNVLADLALESEAHLALTARVARAVDRSARSAGSERDPKEAALSRIATAIGKYWVCRRAPAFINEAQECLGGAGYVEESILPRLYRQAPLNSIWEGSGNIQCLDVLRALGREPATYDALFEELDESAGLHPRFDEELSRLRVQLQDEATLEVRSRFVVERLALALQAGLLLRGNDSAVAEAFVASRLGDRHGQAMGTLAADTPMKSLIDRAYPE